MNLTSAECKNGLQIFYFDSRFAFMSKSTIPHPLPSLKRNSGLFFKYRPSGYNDLAIKVN